MSKLQKYDSYKDSGVEWIGNVPEHWNVVKIKYLMNEKKKTYDMNLNCGSISFGKVIYKDDEKIPLSTKKAYQVVEKGNFLVNPLNLNYDLKSLRIALSDLNVVVSSGYIVLDILRDINKPYLNYLLHRFDVAFMKTLGAGVRQTLNYTDISECELIEPPIEEQQKIASFLDTKTEQLIELLKERKQIVINEAVIKGIDKTVTMKDSGVEWIGDIPEHWEVKKLKYVVKKIGDIDHNMPTSVSSGKPYLMTGDILEKASLINFLDCKQISEKDFLKLSQKIKPVIGDLIFARYATIGTVCYVDIEKDFLVSYSCVTIKPNKEKIIGKYLFYFFKSNIFTKEVSIYINSNTQGNIGIDSLYKTRLVLPQLQKQQQIVEYIENQTLKIDNAIDLQQKQIDKLKEYKTSLIDSVVTGKVRVA